MYTALWYVSTQRTVFIGHYMLVDFENAFVQFQNDNYVIPYFLTEQSTASYVLWALSYHLKSV